MPGVTASAPGPSAPHVRMHDHDVGLRRSSAHQLPHVPQVGDAVEAAVGRESDHRHRGAPDAGDDDLVALPHGVDPHRTQERPRLVETRPPVVVAVVVGLVEQVEALQVGGGVGIAPERQAARAAAALVVPGLRTDRLFEVPRDDVLREPRPDIVEVCPAAIIRHGVLHVVEEDVPDRSDVHLPRARRRRSARF
ncbi:hypothetical protein JM654_18140 [Microbacterium oxydans]|nr:hypothetical protein [Microbacterium oxydans]